MVLVYDKLFKTVDPLSNESATFLVECIDGGDKSFVIIRCLEGEYNSTEEFNETKGRFFDKLQRLLDVVGNPTKTGNEIYYESVSLPMSDVYQLLDALSGALRASWRTAPSHGIGRGASGHP